MRKFLAGLTLVLILGATPSIALADSQENGDVQNNNDDPGMVALHGAAKDLQQAVASLRSECPDKTDAKCKAALMAARDAFKAAREKAIAAHLAFKEEQKKAREAAKLTAKDALKDKTTTQAKDRAARNHQHDDKNAGTKDDKAVLNKDDKNVGDANTQNNDGKNEQAGKNDEQQGGNGTATNLSPKPLVKKESPKPSATPRG